MTISPAVNVGITHFLFSALFPVQRLAVLHRAILWVHISNVNWNEVFIATMPEPNLELLMQMVQKVLDNQKDIRDDVREIKTRLGRLETDVAQLHVFLAEQSTRLDRFSEKLERVERRLEITET